MGVVQAPAPLRFCTVVRLPKARLTSRSFSAGAVVATHTARVPVSRVWPSLARAVPSPRKVMRSPTAVRLALDVTTTLPSKLPDLTIGSLLLRTPSALRSTKTIQPVQLELLLLQALPSLLRHKVTRRLLRMASARASCTAPVSSLAALDKRLPFSAC